MTSAPFPTPPSVDRPTPEQPPVRPQLRRSGTEKMFGGVCGGLAEYSGIDPLLWRVGFVGLTLAGGAGVIIYLLLWVLMPSGPLRPGDSPSAVDRLVDRLHAAASGVRATPPRD
ncbi:MAG TPA: PspC domain-containing protein [Blastococcus sp.]|jgi:phage shock protein C